MNMTAFTADQTRHHPPVPPDHEVIIVGAGISGIGAAIQQKKCKKQKRKRVKEKK